MSKDYLVTFLSDDAGGVQYANTICVHDDELGGPRSPAEFVDEVEPWLKTKYTNCLPATLTLRVLRAFQIPAVYGDDSEIADKIVTQVGALSIGTGTVPRELTMILALRSSHTSRRKMGRLYMPSPRNPSMLDGDANWATGGSYYTNVGLFGQALLDGHDIGIAGADGHLSTRIYSRQTHKEASGDKTSDVDTYTRRIRPHFLRRRTTAP